MGRDYFLKILKYLRFDGKSNRVKRGQRGLQRLGKYLNILLINVKMYKLSLTVDEQLMPLKSHCSFVTFMPYKPDKYGVKFWVLADVKTK